MQGWVTCEEYLWESFSEHWEMMFGKLKPSWIWIRPRGDGDNKKSFYKYIGDKRKIRENVGTLLNEVGHLGTQGMEKVETLNAFFASILTSLQESQIPKTKRRDWIKEHTPLVKEGQIRKYLNWTYMSPWLLKKCWGKADVIVKPLSIIVQWSSIVHGG